MTIFPRMCLTSAVIAITLSGAFLSAQIPSSGTPKLAFEVASIKPNKTGGDNWGWRTDRGGRMTGSNVPLLDLIREAYELQDSQLIGIPDWVKSARYDIVAKGEGDPGDEQIMLMLRALFSERFALAFHREMRDVSIYALAPAKADAKLGPQLITSGIDCDELERTKAKPPPAPVPTAANPRPMQPCSMTINGGSAGQTLSAAAMKMARLAKMLSPFVGRIVVDRTGLPGSFDVQLTWTPNQTSETAGSSLFTALQEQLGLKLESTRAPVDVLVVDHIEQPAPD